MKTIFCPVCKAPLKVVYSGQDFSGWKKCDCGEHVFILAKADGSAASESLKEMLESNRGDVPKMISYMLKCSEERRIDDISFVSGKATESLITKLGMLRAFDKIGFAYKINPAFQDYFSKYAAAKQPKNRDIIEDFLNG